MIRYVAIYEKFFNIKSKLNMKRLTSILRQFKQWILSIVTSRYGKKIKKSKTRSIKIFGLRFEIWNISDGIFLSVDTKTTRYIIKNFKIQGTANVKDLV